MMSRKSADADEYLNTKIITVISEMIKQNPRLAMLVVEFVDVEFVDE